MDLKKTAGEFIREKRTAKAWTQETLSSEAGINNRFLQKIEAGDRMPSIVTVFKLVKALHLSPEKLIMRLWREWLKGESE
jgi:transcriptional regulator with XRE-family HTH domain